MIPLSPAEVVNAHGAGDGRPRMTTRIREYPRERIVQPIREFVLNSRTAAASVPPTAARSCE
jgi:hypothetical protein